MIRCECLDGFLLARLTFPYWECVSIFHTKFYSKRKWKCACICLTVKTSVLLGTDRYTSSFGWDVTGIRWRGERNEVWGGVQDKLGRSARVQHSSSVGFISSVYFAKRKGNEAYRQAAKLDCFIGVFASSKHIKKRLITFMLVCRRCPAVCSWCTIYQSVCCEKLLIKTNGKRK